MIKIQTRLKIKGKDFGMDMTLQNLDSPNRIYIKEYSKQMAIKTLAKIFEEIDGMERKKAMRLARGRVEK